MQFKAQCSANVGGFSGGIVKVLLTVTSQPNSQDEHILCNLLNARGPLIEGRTYLVTIEEDITAMSP
jgi:hypothetical protein